MFDPNAECSRRAIAELKKEGTRAKLVHLALWWTATPADADDLVSDAIERVCDPDGLPWSGAGSFLTHMNFAMRHRADAKRRTGIARFEVVASSFEHEPVAVDAEPLADERLHAARTLAWMRELGAELEAELRASDPDAARAYRLRAQGCETPLELAAAMGCPVDAVYDIDRRIKYRAAQILEKFRTRKPRP